MYWIWLHIEARAHIIIIHASINEIRWQSNWTLSMARWENNAQLTFRITGTFSVFSCMYNTNTHEIYYYAHHQSAWNSFVCFVSHSSMCHIRKKYRSSHKFRKKNIFDSRKIGTAADATAKKKCWVEKKSVHSTHVKCEKEPPCQRGKKTWNILEFCVAKDSFDLSVFNMHIINPYDTTTQAHGEHHTQRMEFEQCFVACLFLAGAFIFICYQRLPVGTKYFLSTSLCCRACVSC